MINPYRSYLVRASAGSGKTYQLSRRFLHLVAAGADPAQVLTVTFTNKAASEMRERILAEASRLIYVPEIAKTFAAQSRAFWQESGQRYAPPRTALQTGKAILDKTQLLAITTIDALFYEWMLRLPGSGQGQANLVDTLTQRQLSRNAFEALCVWLSSRGGLPQELGDINVEGLRTRLQELERYRSLIWLGGETYGDRSQSLWPVTATVDDEGELLRSLNPELMAITQQVANAGKAAQILEALAKEQLAALVDAQLLTKAFTVSGSLIRGKKREALAAEINLVDDAILSFANTAKKQRLNQSGAMQLELAVVLDHLMNDLKRRQGLVDFEDLARGAYEVMHSDDSAGIRYLLAQGTKHLLIDEFQDTSRLQWHIFEPLVEELTAGEGLQEATTVFFVGDEKQSIYGFREADPSLLAHVAQTLSERLTATSMAASYRTAPIVLDFVNKAFAKTRIADFPEHATAKVGGETFVADHGRIVVTPLLAADEDHSAAEQEAAYLAAMLADALARPDDYKVFDRDKRTFRPLRPGDCAILYRSSTNAACYEEALHKAQIPCMRAEEKGFFTRPEITELINLLKWLAAPDDLNALASVLRGPLIDLPEDLVFAALQKSLTARTPTDDVTAKPGKSPCPQSRESRILDFAGKSPRLAALQTLARQTRSSTPPHVVINEVMSKLGAATSLTQAFGTSDAETRLLNSNLTRFVELVCQLEGETSGDMLSVVRKLVALIDLDDIGNAPVTANAVNLMTIHKAKGLEFPLVVLSDTGRPFGGKDRYWLKVQDEDRTRLMHMGTRTEQPFGDADCRGIEERFATDVECESERLLYVAMTRAQHYLFVTGHEAAKSQGFDATNFHSRLWEGCLAAGGSETQWLGQSVCSAWHRTDPLDDDALSQACSPIPPTRAPHPRLPMYTFPATKVSPATETCAKALFYDPAAPQLDPPPLPIAPDLYGNLVHKAIEVALRTGLPCAGIDVVRTEAQEALWLLADLCEGAQSVLPEHPCVIRGNAGAMSGVIDLLVIKADEVWIIDYKTSRLQHPTRKNLKRFAEARGYDQQLALYGKAIKGSFPEHRVRSALLFTAAAKLLEI